MYKVLITTSGTGSRLKELTANTNKALVPVAGRPVIDYIISRFPKDIEFVVTVGYLADQVKNYLNKTFPDRNFNFIDVDNFNDPGSSMGYSMLQAKDQLQCPFIIQCNDTLIFEPIPSPEEGNWNAGTTGSSSESYTSFKVVNGDMSVIADKGAKDFDYLHIGFVGIKDYEVFWQSLEQLYSKDPLDSKLNDTRVINVMLEKGCKFKPVIFPLWLDIGNPESLKQTEEYLKNNPKLIL